jgi:hypothetical protein
MLTLKGWSLQALVLSLSMITIRTPPVLAGLVRKMVFFSHIYIKMLILPRQARDKHRENSKTTAVFLLGCGAGSKGAWWNVTQVRKRRPLFSRFSHSQRDRLPRQAQEVVRKSVEVRVISMLLFCTGSVCGGRAVAAVSV